MVWYLLAGLTDVLDGYTARKLNAQSTLGAKLDSIGDFVFYVLLIAYLATKHKEIVMPYLLFIIIIFLFRIINIVFGVIKYKQLIMIHTIANKLTGFLVFLLPIII
jgi:CDP-diacylglycerol--glycerol-3-phosphate 3-phosphatidyltransferase